MAAAKKAGARKSATKKGAAKKARANKSRAETGFKQEKKPPKSAMLALRPLNVLLCAAEGGDWYNRYCDEHLQGWKPRHPDTGETMSSADLLSWATKDLPADTTYQALATKLAVQAHVYMAKIGLVDKRRAFDANGNLLPIQNMPDDIAAALAGFEVEVQKTTTAEADGGATTMEQTRTVKIKWLDAKDALKVLMQADGKLAEHHKHSGTVTHDLAAIRSEIGDIFRNGPKPASPDA